MTELAPVDPRPCLRSIALASLVVSGSILVLALRSGGFGAGLGGTDLYATFVPKFRESTEILFSGRIPLWNPWEYCGAPILAFAHGAVLYPPIALTFAFFEPFEALQVLYGAHILAYVVLILVYLSRAGLPFEAAIAASILTVSCSFNGLSTQNLDHPQPVFGVIYLVWLLIGWHSFTRGNAKAIAWMALLYGIAWLTGHPQTAAATALMFALVALTTPTRPLYQRMGAAALIIVLGTMLGAIQILPTLEAAAESATRVDQTQIEKWRALWVIHSPRQLAEGAMARYGAPALVMVLLGLIHRAPFRLSWALALCWSTFPANFPFSLMYEVPPASSFRTTMEFAVIQPFFFSCFLAAGIASLRAPLSARSRITLLAAVSLVVLSSLYLHDWLAAFLAAICALAAVRPLHRRGAWLLPILLLAVQVVPILGGVGTTLQTRTAPDFRAFVKRAAQLRQIQATDPLLARVVSERDLEAGVFLPERIASPMGLEPALPPRRMTRLLDAVGLDQLSKPPPGHWRVKWSIRRWSRLAAHPGAAAALGVGFVVVPVQRSAPLQAAGYSLVKRIGSQDLLLYKAPAPRFYIVHAVVASSNDEDSLRKLLNSDFDPSNAVILEGKEAQTAVDPAVGSNEKIELLEYEPERIRLRVHATARGILVTSEAYFPGWEARLNGAAVPILRGNYTFRAIAVPAGLHEVEFRYRPPSFRLGSLVSISGLLAIGVLPVLARLVGRKAQRRSQTRTH